LPTAMVNFLALLGWSYDGSSEIFSLKELIKHFDLTRVVKKGAVFDVEKLTWMNGHYIRQLTAEGLFAASRPWLERAGLLGRDGEREAVARKALALEHDKVKRLADVPALIDFFFGDAVTYDDAALKNLRKVPGGADALRDVAEACASLDEFTAAAVEKRVRELAEEKGVSAGKIIHAMRAALSGRAAGPSLFDMAELLGQRKVVARLMKATAVYKAAGD
jgi:glutamyl/glutaminyl-tRNA synthetase